MKHTPYSKHSFNTHILYPDYFNKKDKGIRASYFYMHGELETMCNYDCMNVSVDLLRKFLRPDVHLATAIVGRKRIKCLVFVDYDNSDRRMRGYAVAITDNKGIDDALEAYPNAYRPSGGDTVDDFLGKNYPELAMKLVNHYYRDVAIPSLSNVG